MRKMKKRVGNSKAVEKLLREFVDFEKQRGIRNLRKIPYLLNPFFSYIDEQDIGLNELNYRQAQEYQTYLATLKNKSGDMHYATTSISDMINTTRNLYTFLKKKGITGTNPFVGIKRIKKQNKLLKNIPKEKQLMEFLDCMRCFFKEKALRDRKVFYKTHVMCEVLYSTGMRISELAGLEVRDIDFETRIVHIRVAKGGRMRKGYLSEYCTQVLKVYIGKMRGCVNKNQESVNLFGVRDGKALDESLNRILKKVGARYGMERFTSHYFRHSLGFHLLRRGCDMRYIQLILGHEEIASTSIYTKVEKGDLKKELDTYHPRSTMKRKEKV